MARVLRERPFLLFLAGSTAGATGYSVYAISVVWLAYSLTRSFLVVGLVLFVEYAAYASTSIVGPWVDRAPDLGRLFLVCYGLQAVAALALGLGFLSGALPLAALIGLVVVLSALWDVAWAAGNAAPARLLDTEHQFAAEGVSGAIGGANTIAGFAAGGALVFLVGPGGGMLLYAALLAAASALSVPLRIPRTGRHAERFVESFRSGWSFLRSAAGKPLLPLAYVDALRAVFTAAPALLITRTALELPGSPGAYAALFVSFVVGGVAGSLALGRWNPRESVGTILAASPIVAGIAVSLLLWTGNSVLLSAIVWAAVGFGLSAFYSAKYAFLRGAVPTEKLGRVVSNLYVFPGVTSATGALLFGALVPGLNDATFVVLVALGFLSTGLLTLAIPSVRRLGY